MDKQQIQKQAKQILDKFAKALDKVDSDNVEVGVDRQEFEREEGTIKKQSKDCYDKNTDFKQKILGNAPNHNNDFIIAEKGSWK